MSYVQALRDVHLNIPSGRITGIIGESGSGKSTLARVICGLYKPDAGRLFVQSQDVADWNAADWQKFRRETGIVFQDPYSSLNPRHTIREILSEPWKIHARDLNWTPEQAIERVETVLKLVSMPSTCKDKFPSEFSGGQRQRIAIARALFLSPQLLILDEAVSALDVSVQAQIVNLLKDLQSESGITMVFISHDLRVVRYLCDEVAVMYLGTVVESGKTSRVLKNPRHPYTRALLDSEPEIHAYGRKLSELSGEVPSPVDPPTGCAFHTRCSRADGLCFTQPVFRQVSQGGYACHHPLET